MKHGDKVVLDNSKLTGIIVGTASINRSPANEFQFLYMVELDEGFYDESRKIWTSILAVDPFALTRPIN